tara:strand:+ start:2040 stop:2900 length:861 start_codon:yes stop_codon:yes gene_type:complete
MSHPVKGVDHCFVLVDDLDKAAAQYQALGFTLSPRGLHSEAKGSANYTIMFPDDYFELLGILKATPLNEARRKSLAEAGQGLHAIACRIDSAEEAQNALTDLGIGTHGLGSFERPVPLPSGGDAVAAFSTVVFDADQVPMGSVFMCQHKTPETVWLPELLSHPNTTCGLHALLAVSETPEEHARQFARLWADGRVVMSPDAFTVETGENSAPLVLLTQEALEARYPGMDLSGIPTGIFSGLQLKTADLNAAKSCLKDAGIATTETALGLAVAPQDTSGVILEFVPV